MIRKSVLARYARSLAEAASEASVVPEIRANFDHFLSLLEQVPELPPLLRNPVLPASLKQQVLRAIADRCGYHAFFADFLRILVENHRESCIPQLHALFLEECDRLEGVVRATLTAARPLGAERKQELAAGLALTLGGRVELEEHLDESLIGGLCLQAGGTVYDGTVRGQLQRLTARLAQLG